MGGEECCQFEGSQNGTFRNDTKQAYPVATGLVRGFDPLDPKGRTLPNLSGSAVLPLIGLLRKSFNEYRKSL